MGTSISAAASPDGRLGRISSGRRPSSRQRNHLHVRSRAAGVWAELFLSAQDSSAGLEVPHHLPLPSHKTPHPPAPSDHSGGRQITAENTDACAAEMAKKKKKERKAPPAERPRRPWRALTLCRRRRFLLTIANSYHEKLELADSDITLA